MTDLNKLISEFETWFTTTDVYKRISHQIEMCGSGRHQDISTVFQRDDWNEDNYAQVSVMASWLAWQEKSKAQVVPDGYFLVPKDIPDRVVSCLENSRFHWGDRTRDYYTPIYSLMVEVASESGDEG
ncbi:hypothetical protein BS46_gp101 [Acinetobacter phage BS46]|nr:hypothetical protein BS46_gp101 [Acinetobacter phage BS46]